MELREFSFAINEKTIVLTKNTMVFLVSGWQDSNLRPPAPKAGAMTGLRYTPINIKMRRDRDSNPGDACASTD